MEGIAFRYINVFLSDSAVERMGFTQYYVQKPSLIVQKYTKTSYIKVSKIRLIPCTFLRLKKSRDFRKQIQAFMHSVFLFKDS